MGDWRLEGEGHRRFKSGSLCVRPVSVQSEVPRIEVWQSEYGVKTVQKSSGQGLIELERSRGEIEREEKQVKSVEQ